MTKTKNALFALPVLAAILIGGMMAPSFAMPNTFICDGLVEDQTIARCDIFNYVFKIPVEKFACGASHHE